MADYNGTDSFSYSASGNTPASGPTVVSLNVTPAVDAPSAQTGVLSGSSASLGVESWLFDGSNFQAVDATAGPGSTYRRQTYEVDGSLVTVGYLNDGTAELLWFDAEGPARSQSLDSAEVVAAGDRVFATLNVRTPEGFIFDRMPVEIDPNSGTTTPISFPNIDLFGGFRTFDGQLVAVGNGGLSYLDLASGSWIDLEIPLDANFTPTAMLGDFMVGIGYVGDAFKLVTLDLTSGEFQAAMPEPLDGISFGSVTLSNGNLYVVVQQNGADFLARVDADTGTAAIVLELGQQWLQTTGPDDAVYLGGRPSPEGEYGLYRLDPDTNETELLIDGLIGTLVPFDGDFYFSRNDLADIAGSGIYKLDESTGNISRVVAGPSSGFQELQTLGLLNDELAYIVDGGSDHSAIWLFDGTHSEQHVLPNVYLSELQTFDGDYLNESLGQVLSPPIA
jgi:hypothetical protein